jgi:hypothetical protein
VQRRRRQEQQSPPDVAVAQVGGEGKQPDADGKADAGGGVAVAGIGCPPRAHNIYATDRRSPTPPIACADGRHGRTRDAGCPSQATPSRLV